MSRVTLAVVMSLLVASAVGVVLQPAPPSPNPKSGSPDVMFDLVFISTPVNGINHAVAGSEELTTSLTSSNIIFSQKNMPNSQEAMWLSETGKQVGSTWSEVGNITFPSGDAIIFRSFGLSGHIKNGPTSGSSYGGISYDIYDGTGQYKGASGVMVDTFIGPAGATSFPIHGVGFFWLPTDSKSAA